MEPVDYLKVLKNHWKVVVALVVLAVVAIFFTSPKQASKAFAADHTLLLNSTTGERTSSGFSNVQVAALYAQNGDVAERVGAAIGWEGSVDGLMARIEAFADSDLGTITLTSHAGNPDDAVAIANAFGDELRTFVDERESERVDAREIELREELTQLGGQLAQDPSNGALQAEYDFKVAELETFFSASKASYATLEFAVTAREDAGFVAGVGRAQRAVLAALVAALAGFGVAIMLDRSDSRLRTKDQAERRFGLPVLAEVPLLALRDRSKAAVVAFERESRVAEAYRSLRTALLLFRSRNAEPPAVTTNGNGRNNATAAPVASPSTARQLVVVTSPEAGDGKSTTTANLAMAYAEAGESVLLVSWDLWRPLSPGVFDAEEGPGVADYLEGNGTSLVRYVQDTSIPGVRIVTAGLGGHHPYTQIENARRLLEEARTLANVVIVDTAPILSASVTRELVTLADAVIVVCRAGRTTGPAADRCAELLERLGAPTLGVVLVGVPTGPFADYYGSPPKESRGLGRAGARRRTEDASPRHKAPTGSPSRPSAAQYRASIPRGSEGRESR